MSTDATGTPTSPDSIPTFNTSVDAPSGLGFNAAMAAIQTALSARVSKPSSVVSGEVPVWNGTTWVRSSVTNIGPTSLGSGTPSSSTFLRGDGTWAASTSAVEIAYTEFTSNVTATVVSEASAVTVVTAGTAVTGDGSAPYLVEFFAPQVQVAINSTATVVLTLWDGSTDLGQLGVLTNGVAMSASEGFPVRVSRRLVPSATTHTYSVRAHATVSSGTVLAGAGGASTLFPGYIRVTKAA